jgi:hypothetical protein
MAQAAESAGVDRSTIVRIRCHPSKHPTRQQTGNRTRVSHQHE